MRGRLADEQEMAAGRQHILRGRLPRIEVIAEIDRIERGIVGAMGGKPAPCRHAFAVLLVVAVLRHDEFWLKCPYLIMPRRPQRRRPYAMKIFDLAAAALAYRATRTMKLGREVISRAVEGDQPVMAEPAKRSEPAAALQQVKRRDQWRMKTFRRNPIQHVPNVIIARDFGHPEQRLAIRSPMPRPLRQMPLMGEKRRALHEEHRKRRHADIRHRVLAALTTAPVRQPRAGLRAPPSQAPTPPHPA